MVRSNLNELPGVEKCDVSYEQGKATLVFAPGIEPDIDFVRAAVSELGFQPREVTVSTLPFDEENATTSKGGFFSWVKSLVP